MGWKRKQKSKPGRGNEDQKIGETEQVILSQIMVLGKRGRDGDHGGAGVVEEMKTGNRFRNMKKIKMTCIEADGAPNTTFCNRRLLFRGTSRRN